MGTLLLDALEAAKEYIGINQVRRAIVYYKLAPLLESNHLWVPDIREENASEAIGDVETFVHDNTHDYAYITLLYNNHYSSVLLDKGKRLCTLFDSSWNTGAYEPYAYLNELEQTLKQHNYTLAYGLEKGCQLPSNVPGVPSEDTFCQSWALYLPMIFLKNKTSESSREILDFIAEIVTVFWDKNAVNLLQNGHTIHNVLGGWYAKPGMYEILFVKGGSTSPKLDKYKRRMPQSQKFKKLRDMKKALQNASPSSYQKAFWSEVITTQSYLDHCTMDH